MQALEQANEGAGKQVLEALEEAEAARLIGPAATPGSYRFVHALIRETLYDAVLSLRRARLHRQAGEALEQLWCWDETHLAELHSISLAHLPQGIWRRRLLMPAARRSRRGVCSGIRHALRTAIGVA